MTTGWTGQRYDGIPAGRVSSVGTMAPAPALLGVFPPSQTPGLSYFLARGQNANFAPFVREALRSPNDVQVPPLGCALKGCGVPPMAYCRSLRCQEQAVPLPGVGCVRPTE